MRLVFVNRFFHPDHSATCQILTDLCFGMAAMGHEVHVVTSGLRYDDPGAGLESREEVRGVRIHRVWTSRFGRMGLAGRAVDYLTFYLSALVRLVREAECGAVFDVRGSARLAECIVRMAGDLSLARRCGENARQLFDERFEKRIAIARWERCPIEVAGR